MNVLYFTPLILALLLSTSATSAEPSKLLGCYADSAKGPPRVKFEAFGDGYLINFLDDPKTNESIRSKPTRFVMKHQLDGNAGMTKLFRDNKGIKKDFPKVVDNLVSDNVALVRLAAPYHFENEKLTTEYVMVVMMEVGPIKRVGCP